MTGGMYEFLRSWDQYLACASSARIGQRSLSSTIWIARIVMSWISQARFPLAHTVNHCIDSNNLGGHNPCELLHPTLDVLSLCQNLMRDPPAVE